jgi:hypothetical protein
LEENKTSSRANGELETRLEGYGRVAGVPSYDKRTLAVGFWLLVGSFRSKSFKNRLKIFGILITV